ncbi:hypothetical protein TNIN_11291 [Trichonephila inaurata madagascariensis]|uniref:Uncharacterized protein n=1 Tax=Trichonephila inaurata madagascariensis TaxID=2747483 RepID=A0A8X7BVX9_9ARAC|nr:hypothetical protein TNIN_11291 [Trichonephila inaurata madagascariensis]
MFWLSYNVIFVTQDGYLHYLSCMVGELFHYSIIGLVIISASSADRAVKVAKEAVMTLPVRISQYYNELKVILRKNSKENICLTLWKAYKIDTSLIISALGVVMSYGFLIAISGTVSSHNDK